MLFQTGYLTIKQRFSDPFRGEHYRLGFPSLEVHSAFSRLCLETTISDAGNSNTNRNRLWDILEAGDSKALRELFPAYFASLGLMVIPEDVTNRGRIDLTVIGPKGIWIFGFKVKSLDKSGAEAPLARILRKDYAAKYRDRMNVDGQAPPLRQIGIIFDEVARNVVGWEEA